MAIGAYYGSLSAPEKRHYQSVGPNSGQSYPANSPRNGLADVSGIDGVVESAIAKPQPRNTDEREQRDLAAQESMAVFAYWMFLMVGLQTVLAAGALIALVKDLRQNRRSAEQQLRAYVVVEEVVINPHSVKPGHLYIAVSFKNVGETPATAVSASIFGKVVHGAQFRCEMEAGETSGGASSLVLAKDSKPVWVAHNLELYHGLSGPTVLGGDYSTFAFGFIRYKDVFGKDRLTTFCFVTNPRTRETPVTIAAAGDGNCCE